jgi:hypothetical protein
MKLDHDIMVREDKGPVRSNKSRLNRYDPSWFTDRWFHIILNYVLGQCGRGQTKKIKGGQVILNGQAIYGSLTGSFKVQAKRADRDDVSSGPSK